MYLLTRDVGSIPTSPAKTERWPSGLRLSITNRPCEKSYREFESHPFRHIIEYHCGKVGEWLIPADCKSAVFDIVGSNPTLSTIKLWLLVCRVHYPH